MKGVQYSSFYKQQLLPSNIAAGSDWALDVIGNGVNRISDGGGCITKCDIGVQLEGCDIYTSTVRYIGCQQKPLIRTLEKPSLQNYDRCLALLTSHTLQKCITLERSYPYLTFYMKFPQIWLSVYIYFLYFLRSSTNFPHMALQLSVYCYNHTNIVGNIEGGNNSQTQTHKHKHTGQKQS